MGRISEKLLNRLPRSRKLAGELRREAVARGWPVLVFTRPVGLRRRMRLPPRRQTLTGAAVGTAVAVGGVVYAAARRRIDRGT